MVAPGRFHVFDLARALLASGHQVDVFSNYPFSEAQKFGLKRQQYHSAVWHRIILRIFSKLLRFSRLQNKVDAFIHITFSKWAAHKLKKGQYDLVYAMSGVAKDILEKKPGRLNLLVRGSSHIRYQLHTLERESRRVGCDFEKPSSWMVKREEEEYLLADRVVVLSSYAFDSFICQGFSERKLKLLLSATDTSHFESSEAQHSSRLRRIKSGQKLRVLTVSSFSFRKGINVYLQITKCLAQQYDFIWVGECEQAGMTIEEKLPSSVVRIGRVPHHQLVKYYAEADVFLFPSIEDGYPAVLAQAISCGLIPIASKSCSAPDLINDGVNGFLFDSGDKDRVIRILEKLEKDRLYADQIALEAHKNNNIQNWSDMANNLVTQVTQND